MERLTFRRLGLGVVAGLAIGGCVAGAFGSVLHYVSPARTDPRTAETLRPLIEGRWLKAPFDIVRSQECLAQSTITLRRQHEYGGDLGVREDVVTLGLYNTTITGLGTAPVMLWFELPDGLGGGDWDYVSKTQDDCGGWLDIATRRPRTTRIGSVHLGSRP